MVEKYSVIRCFTNIFCEVRFCSDTCKISACIVLLLKYKLVKPVMTTDSVTDSAMLSIHLAFNVNVINFPPLNSYVDAYFIRYHGIG
jgi:hypothetical protein